MIKLKNLWKIALTAIAMSAMLVACEPEDNNKKEEEKDPKETTPVVGPVDNVFPYGFKFTSEEGWANQYINSKYVKQKYTGKEFLDVKFDKTYVKVNGETVGITVKNSITDVFPDIKDPDGKDYLVKDHLVDDSTKIYINADEFAPGKLYTLTYDKKNGTVKLTNAAAGAKATSTDPQKANAEGEFPAGIYISGYLGKWAVDSNAGEAIKMDVVNASNEVYAFTWESPAATITVTLKIIMLDGSVLYLKDYPVKTDGTTAIDGSAFAWNATNGGTAVTIKNEDGSEIKGGIYDVVTTGPNQEQTLSDYCNGNENVDLAEKFRMDGADDVLKLVGDKFVPYVKGKEAVFSWKNAQDKLTAPEA